MAFTRITEQDLEGKGVMGQPEVPGLSAAEMQASVEQIVREVAIPGVNRLADELEEETGAASIGMERPSGVAQSVPATVQGVVEAHVESRANPHAVTAAQVGAYTRAETDAAIDGKVVEIGAGDMAKAVYAANGETGVVDRAQRADAADDGAKVYTHSKTGTVHNFSGPAVPGGGIVGRVLAMYDFAQGDTFTINGEPYTAYMGAEDAIDAMAGQNYAGKWLLFVADPGWGTLNFKGGGGKVTVTGLSAGNIAFDASVTVKQGTKIIASEAGKYTCLASYVTVGNQGYKGFYINADGEFTTIWSSGPTLSFTVGGTITRAYIKQMANGRGYSWNFGGVTGSSVEGGSLQTHDYRSSFTDKTVYQSYNDVINNVVYIMGYLD